MKSSLTRLAQTAPASLALVALLALPTIGCDLSDNAKKSADNSGAAAANSGRAADTGENLNELSQNGTAIGRIAGARDARRHELESLEHALTFDAKASSASSYLAAFEFQLVYPGMGQMDTQEIRLSRVSDGVTEFGRAVKDYLDPKLAPISVLGTFTSTDPSAERSRNLNAMAIAAALHRVNPYQLDASVKFKFETISMFDALARGLNQGPAIAKGDVSLASQPKYIDDVLREAPAFTYLMQLRMNVLTALALRNVISEADLAGIIGKTQTSWKPNFSKLSISIAGAQIDRLKLALQTRQALGGAQIRPEMEFMLAGLIATMNSAEPVYREGENEAGKTKMNELLGVLKATQGAVNAELAAKKAQ